MQGRKQGLAWARQEEARPCLTSVFGHSSELVSNPPHLLSFLMLSLPYTYMSKKKPKPVKYVREVIKCHAKYAHKSPNYVHLHSLSLVNKSTIYI